MKYELPKNELKSEIWMKYKLTKNKLIMNKEWIGINYKLFKSKLEVTS
jgi:hypothetical protein